jgi:hypothetical protein
MQGEVLDGFVGLVERVEIVFENLIDPLAELHAVPVVPLASNRVFLDSA